MASDRVSKYFDDAKLLLASNNISKISSEISKLKVWAVKHQNETISDGSKTKLLATVELYYRYCVSSTNKLGLLEPTSALLSDYLQLPEGKLLSAKDKKKVLNWLQELTSIDLEGNNASSLQSNVRQTTQWSVQSVNSSGSFTILNEDNPEEYEDNFVVKDKVARAKIADLIAQNKVVLLKLDNSMCIVDVIESEE